MHRGKLSRGLIFVDKCSATFGGGFNFCGCVHRHYSMCACIHVFFVDRGLTTETTKTGPLEKFSLYSIYQMHIITCICEISQNKTFDYRRLGLLNACTYKSER